jgi:hypothetical protein
MDSRAVADMAFSNSCELILRSTTVFSSSKAWKGTLASL